MIKTPSTCNECEVSEALFVCWSCDKDLCADCAKKLCPDIPGPHDIEGLPDPNSQDKPKGGHRA